MAVVSNDYCVFEKSTSKSLICVWHFLLQESVKSAATSSALKSWRLTSRASSDVLRFDENQERIRSLEQHVKKMKGHVDVARAKENLATNGEAFILESLKTMNQQQESKIVSAFPYRFIQIDFLLLSQFSYWIQSKKQSA